MSSTDTDTDTDTHPPSCTGCLFPGGHIFSLSLSLSLPFLVSVSALPWTAVGRRRSCSRESLSLLLITIMTMHRGGSAGVWWCLHPHGQSRAGPATLPGVCRQVCVVSPRLPTGGVVKHPMTLLVWGGREWEGLLLYHNRDHNIHAKEGSQREEETREERHFVGETRPDQHRTHTHTHTDTHTGRGDRGQWKKKVR